MSDEEETVTIPRSVLRLIVDAAVAGDTAASGFLDDALRTAAVVLGVDPMDVTPPEHLCRIEGKHGRPYRFWGQRRLLCLRCGAVL